MATQTAGGVFQLATRFVGASGGRAFRLTTPLRRDSAGPVRFTHGSCESLSKQTAELIDWPPDRRDTRTNASPITQKLLQRLISAPPPTAALERQRYQIQTAPPEQSQTYRASHKSDDSLKGITQNTPETQAAGPSDTFTSPQTHKRDNPHARPQTNRCLDQPLPAPLSQNKRKRALAVSPPKATANTSAKVSR